MIRCISLLSKNIALCTIPIAFLFLCFNQLQHFTRKVFFCQSRSLSTSRFPQYTSLIVDDCALFILSLFCSIWFLFSLGFMFLSKSTQMHYHNCWICHTKNKGFLHIFFDSSPCLSLFLCFSLGLPLLFPSILPSLFPHPFWFFPFHLSHSCFFSYLCLLIFHILPLSP